MRIISRIVLTTLLIFAPLLANAQDKLQQHVYHLFFRLQELDGGGKIVNTRSFSTTLATGMGHDASIRSGTRVPVRTKDDKDGPAYTYIDVGVNIDARNALEEESSLNLVVNAEASSLIAPVSSSSANPVIRQNRWSSSLGVPIGKPTIIFSSDNLEDKGKIQLEMTATPEK